MFVTRSVASRRFVWISDGVVEYSLYFLIIFTPFAFGTVEPWSIAIAEVVVFTMALAWGLTMARFGSRRPPSTSAGSSFWVLGCSRLYRSLFR